MKTKKLLIIALVVVMALSMVSLVACNNDSNQDGEGPVDVRFAAPEGSPALAMLRLPVDNPTIADKYNMEYAVVKPANIASEMASNKAQVVIMPVNAGANLIRQGAEYTLVGIAVEGSLYMVGKTENGGTITSADLVGKKIACIGQTGVPGIVFRYVMSHLGIEKENVEYVADGQAAIARLNSGMADFIVVGEPAATQVKAKLGAEKVNAELSMQDVYSEVSKKASYPQAGIFVANSLKKDEQFMFGLFSALSQSKAWALANPASVSAFAQENLYEGAVFPAASIARCAISSVRLDATKRDEVLSFLKNVMPQDSNGNPINWDSAKNSIFGLVDDQE